MLAVISPLIKRGVIDNTERDLIDLRLWCIDEQEPLHFRMPGNCLRDIAGCRVNFHNKSAFPSAKELPEPIQKLRRERHCIFPGDITLSRRVPEENNRGFVANSLSIEFFVDDYTRLLIETSDFGYELSLPQWQMSDSENLVQQQINMEALRRHVVANVASYRAPVIAQRGEMPPCEWDDKLNRAEAYMSIYPTIKEKYARQPGGYLAACYVMERLSIISKAAESDEQNLPPSEWEPPRDWTVLDFMDPQDAPEVEAAMQTPLFKEVSSMTAVVQKYIINGSQVVCPSQKAAAFTAGYAGVVTHILSTLLLTRQKNYPVKLAMARMDIITKRMQTLPQLCRDLPIKTNQSVQKASQRLLQSLRDFQNTISR